MANSKIVKLVVFCVGLLIIRIIHTHHISFVFLLWNLFLAWLPYYLIKRFNKRNNRYFNLFIFALTILFLPNAPYILTDLFHLKQGPHAPLWFDLILILSFALAGMFFFILTVKEMLELSKKYFQLKVSQVYIKISIMALSAYGVYLGRYLRFNSWDIVSDPLNLAVQMARSFFGTGHMKETVAMTFTFSIFLFLVYEFFEVLTAEQLKTKSDDE